MILAYFNLNVCANPIKNNVKIELCTNRYSLHNKFTVKSLRIILISSAIKNERKKVISV